MGMNYGENVSGKSTSWNSTLIQFSSTTNSHWIYRNLMERRSRLMVFPRYVSESNPPHCGHSIRNLTGSALDLLDSLECREIKYYHQESSKKLGNEDVRGSRVNFGCSTSGPRRGEWTRGRWRCCRFLHETTICNSVTLACVFCSSWGVITAWDMPSQLTRFHFSLWFG